MGHSICDYADSCPARFGISSVGDVMEKFAVSRRTGEIVAQCNCRGYECHNSGDDRYNYFMIQNIIYYHVRINAV